MVLIALSLQQEVLLSVKLLLPNLQNHQLYKGRFASFYNSLDKSFFYSGKSCDDIYGCTPEPISTVNDDRVNNKRNTGALVNADSYGAQADNKNASQFAISEII